jgi:hypothetical protein
MQPTEVGLRYFPLLCRAPILAFPRFCAKVRHAASAAGRKTQWARCRPGPPHRRSLVQRPRRASQVDSIAAELVSRESLRRPASGPANPAADCRSKALPRLGCSPAKSPWYFPHAELPRLESSAVRSRGRARRGAGFGPVGATRTALTALQRPFEELHSQGHDQRAREEQ